MNRATEVLNEIEEASRLENRTKISLGPESDEDRAMYDVNVLEDENAN